MKEIQLTQGYVTQVDDEDYEWLNQWKWYVQKKPHNNYVMRSEGPFGKQKKISMHRFILGLTDPNMLADHKNHNGLNNQRSNLRVSTSSQNQANRRISKSKKSSKYLGVYWSKVNNNWFAQILKKHIGCYDNEIDAAIAYNNEAKKVHGDFANLNEVVL